MSKDKTCTELAQVARRNLDRCWRLGGAMLLAVFLVMASGCGPAESPLEKAFDAVGGKQALLDLRGFSYETTGDRFEAGQGATPTAEPMRSSSFTAAVSCDLENDQISFDWQRQISHPLRGELAYRDVLSGALGFQTGNDSVLNPPGTTAERALPSSRIGALRREFRLLNPHLYLREVAENEELASIKEDIDLDGRTHHVMEVRDEAGTVELFIDAESGQLSKLQTLQNDHIWGDVATEVAYRDWTTAEGSSLMVPHEVELAVAGTTLHRATRSNVVVNPDFAVDSFSLPDEPRTEVDAAAMERGGRNAQYHTRWHALGLPLDEEQTTVIATSLAGDPDVQHLTGGTHHSLAIKMGEGVVVVESPLNEARSRAVLNKLDELWPGVPVSHLILTHHHYDHMGGIRTYAAAGATIVTSGLNSSYVEDALNSPHTLVPDELATAKTALHIEAVPEDEEFSLEIAGRSVKAKHVPTTHSQDMLVVYLPENRLLFNSDLYFPGRAPPSQPLPQPVRDWAQGLRDRLPELGWDVQWIAGGHAGVGTVADLHSHFEGAGQ